MSTDIRSPGVVGVGVAAFGVGVLLWILSGPLNWIASLFVPGFASFIDELIWFGLLVGLLFGLSSKGIVTKVVTIALLCFGYWAMPWLGKTTYFFLTRDSYAGTIVTQRLDEQAGGTGVRKVFIVQRHDTCETSQYVSRDLVIPLIVYHSNSAETRDLMAVGGVFDFVDTGTRRYKNQIPFIGNFLGLGFFADWTEFPNIISAKKIEDENRCR
ncbi:hypothetical protein [Roseibium sp. Sym1]|uniref:hypothetical protein n=1 Tax=Roseibium sp. Sym1 TaxID=3016006 RepID=UPI0022B34452|nr:hypothetical protein [Roseibium sp. Sym1]